MGKGKEWELVRLDRYAIISTIMLFIANGMMFSVHAHTHLDWGICEKQRIHLDDGDSFSCDKEPIRVLGIDTPEIKHPDHGIMKDQPFGQAAAKRTKELITAAKRIVIVRGGKDPYNRTLAHVLIDGRLLGGILLKEGLAYENISRYGDNGLPVFALEIMEIARISKKPAFMDPHLWRKKNRKK